MRCFAGMTSMAALLPCAAEAAQHLQRRRPVGIPVSTDWSWQHATGATRRPSGRSVPGMQRITLRPVNHFCPYMN